jgi:hypothetical protein
MTAKNKEQIRQSMLEHLLTKGYPNMTGDQIMGEITNLWQKLASEGLLEEPIREGLTYQHFVNIALQSKHNQDTMDEVARFFNNRNGRS